MNSPGFQRLIFAGVVGLAAVLVASEGVSAQTKGRLVEEVVVIGYRRLAREEILSHISTRAGDVYNEEKVKGDFRTLLDLSLFNRLNSSASIEDGPRGGVVVTFTVFELPLVENVKFFGLPDGVSESEIIRALAAERLHMVKGAAIGSVELRKTERVIAKYLAAHGWPESGVDVTLENISMGNVAITVSISLRF